MSNTSFNKDDSCDGRVCEEGQVLNALSSVCVTLDQCESVICASEEIKTADCECVTQDPCSNVTCGSGEICEDGTCVEDPNALREVIVAGFVNDGYTWTCLLYTSPSPRD